MLDDLKAALACQPDVLEWRIDWLEDISPAAVCALLEKVRAAAGNIPLLVTFRTSHEGGRPRAISAVDLCRAPLRRAPHRHGRPH